MLSLMVKFRDPLDHLMVITPLTKMHVLETESYLAEREGKAINCKD